MQAGVDNPVTDAEMQEALLDRETAAARALSDFNKRNSTVCGIEFVDVAGLAVELLDKLRFTSYCHMHLWARTSCGALLQASSLRPGASEGGGSATMTAMEAARAGRQLAAASTPRRDPTIYQSSIDFTHSSAKEGIKFDTVNAAGDLALPVEWRPLRTEYHPGSPVPAFVITLQVSSPTVANQEGFAGVWLLPAKDCPAMGILEVRKLPATGKHRQFSNCATLFGDVPMYCSIVSGFKSDKWVFEKVPATTRLGVQLMRDKFTIQMMVMPAGPGMCCIVGSNAGHCCCFPHTFTPRPPQRMNEA